MELTPQKIKIKTGNKWIAVLNTETAHRLDLHPGDRVHLKNSGNPEANVTAILEISENGGFAYKEIGLFTETWGKLQLQENDRVLIGIAEKPESVMYIREKLDGKKLTPEKIDVIIRDVVADDLSDVEMSYFVSGCYVNGLDDEETVALTKAIVTHGSHLSFGDEIIVDKHCIGGVPGNRTTMMIVPIMSALGFKMPKTSSRAITSPAGTADTMEVLCDVTIPAERLEQIIKEVGGFITWGGGVDLAAADDRMIRVRHPLSLDPQGMLLASILAKKKAAGSTHVLIDIPVGDQVKVKTKEDGEKLAQRFRSIGAMLNMRVEVIMTNGDQPIGKGIGPVLEALDVLHTLKNDSDASKDLYEKATDMAGTLLEMTGKAPKGQGKNMAKEVVDSGKAYEQMMRIIKAQGAKPIPEPGHFTFCVRADKTGTVARIDNKGIASIARVAGAPKDAGAGIVIMKKLGDTVQVGDHLYCVYAENADRLKYAVEFWKRNSAYTIAEHSA